MTDDRINGVSGFDIIGDIHGCAGKLRGLLNQLGYRQRNGTFRHPGRQAVFVGDLIDRGPDQVDTVNTVRSMVDAGTARVTMGNHEFNAISFATPDPEKAGEFMRPHGGPKGPKNLDQHGEFLKQVDESKRVEFLEWFKTLPLWLDLDGVRIVHACWHDASIKVLAAVLGQGPMSEDFVVRANTTGTQEFEAVETVLKGPEVELGEHHGFRDGRHIRTAARIRWWDPGARTLREIAEIPPGSRTPKGRPYPDLGDEPCAKADEYRYENDKPVFFGHYWRTGTPRVDGPRTACVDFSAIRGGPLVAYRFDGEATLVDANMVAFGRG